MNSPSCWLHPISIIDEYGRRSIEENFSEEAEDIVAEVNFCSYEVWEEFVKLGEKVIESRITFCTTFTVSERFIHHVVCQAKQFLSGLITVQS